MAKPRKGAAQSQAQANKQQEVSKQESLSLVQNLLRVSVFHTAYLRGLFPEHKFQATTMRNLENMKIRMLAPTCPETKRMNDWIEKDVHEALTAGYLHSLHFCVCKDRDGTDLIEQYTYTFAYTSDGKACLDVRVSNKKKGKTVRNKAPPDPESIRCQVVRMLRMLVEITSTLDRMPEERYLLMKVEYTENTPEDFGTPNFSPAGPEQLKAHFERSPFSISAGEVETGHHSVSVRVHSIMDLDDDDPEDGATPDEQDEQDAAAKEGAAGGIAGPPKEDEQAVGPGESRDNVMAGGDDREEEPQGKDGRRPGTKSRGAERRGNHDELMISPDSSPSAAAGVGEGHAARQTAVQHHTGQDGDGLDGTAPGPPDTGRPEKAGMPVQRKAGKRRATRDDTLDDGEDVKMTPKPSKQRAGADDNMRGVSDDDGLGDAGGPSQGLIPSQGAVVVCSQGKRRGAAARSPIEQVKRFKGCGYGRMAAMRCS